ncbi:MAG: glycosyltransferase [Bacteroidia bacterium]|nr:glycosyltransferase [Bacteroidia bacterium]
MKRQDLQLFSRPAPESPAFSVLIPSWNNLPYLQLCLRSLRTHSQLPLQLIVIVNEGRDGTLDWVRNEPDLDYVYAPDNIGICYALNLARTLARATYLVYVNDDMYLLPDWDTALMAELEAVGHPYCMFSATMIEPHDTGNPCVIVQDYGTDIGTFSEQNLLQEAPALPRRDWSGSTWPPNVLHRDLWDLVGGMSIEFSPGMYSDPDLSMKCWQAGVRIFKGVAASRVYHFGSKSTGRVRKNKGRDTFLLKWGISARFFADHYLRRGAPWTGPLPDPVIPVTARWIHRIRRALKSLR